MIIQYDEKNYDLVTIWLFMIYHDFMIDILWYTIIDDWMMIAHNLGIYNGIYIYTWYFYDEKNHNDWGYTIIYIVIEKIRG